MNVVEAQVSAVINRFDFAPEGSRPREGVAGVGCIVELGGSLGQGP